MSKNLEIPQFKSCLPPTPFIEYGGGPSTKIDANLPQTNEFSAYGVLPVDMTNAAFKTGVVAPLPDPFFAEVTALKIGTPDEIKGKIAAKLRGMFSTHIKPKNFPVSGTEKIVDPAWVTAANYSVPVQYIFVPKMIDNFVDYLGDMPFSEVVDKVNTEGVKPLVTINYAQQALVTFEKAVTATMPSVPNLLIIEEYRMAAYLGKYGMGRVVKTFTLLPGEKTTITVKTYKDTTTTQTKSENVLDSYSQSSANELDSLIKGETDNTTTSKRSLDSMTKLSLTGGPFMKLAGFGASTDLNIKTESSRSSNVKSLNQAIEKHVNNSNSNRQIQVNTTTTETTKAGEESSTVRELVNLNKSRVLNFVFRQLHQQYITVTYLADIKIAFTNGYEPDTRIVSLEELRPMLVSVLKTPADVDWAEYNILRNYCNVYNYKDEGVEFIKPIEREIGTCIPRPAPNTTVAVSSTKTIKAVATLVPSGVEFTKFWRKNKALGEKSVSIYGLDINVPGVILSVKESTLKTSSVLAEAMLGQADALDCFNLKIQDSEAQKGYIENTERLTRLQNEEWKARHDRAKQQQEIERMQTDNELVKFQMEIVREIKDPVQRAEMYKKNLRHVLRYATNGDSKISFCIGLFQS
jgi:hypothetical protein